MNPKSIDVIIVDDHPMLIDGIIMLNEKLQGFNVIGRAGDGRELIKQLRTLKPDVVLLDLEMKGMDGFETMERLRDYFPRIKVIILTGHDSIEFIRHSIKNGACGFLLKESRIEEIVKAVQAVMEKGFYFENVSKSLFIENESEKNNGKFPLLKKSILTEREMDVLKLLIKDWDDYQIANKLRMSIETVRSHKKHIIEKTNSKTILGAVVYALRNKLFV